MSMVRLNEIPIDFIDGLDPTFTLRQLGSFGRYGGAEEIAVGMEEHARTTLGSVVGAIDIWKCRMNSNPAKHDWRLGRKC